MKNRMLKIKNKLQENKKRAVAWLLVGSMVLGICPMSDFISRAAEAEKKGTILSEENTGDMNIIPYNNEDLLVDLGGAAWGTIAVADVNQDGYMDFLMGCGSTPYEGTKVFYGKEESQKSGTDGYLVMDICRRIHSNTQLMGSTIYDNDDQGDYIRTLITAGGWQTGDAVNYPGGTAKWNYVLDQWDTKKDLYLNQLGEVAKTVKTVTQADMFVDFDGDGCLDRIVGLQSDDDFGWYYGAPNLYNKDGVWDSDNDGKENVLHSWIFWHENPRDAADYAEKDITETIALASGETDMTFGEPQVVKVYEYTTDERGNKIIDQDSAKPLDVYGNSQPQFRDWDNDGDLDIICGSFINEITYFENVGDRKNPIYVTGRNLVAAEDGSDIYAEHFFLSVTSAKWNDDPYFDLLVTGEDGRVFLLENTGDKTKDNTPIFKKAQYFQQPADSLQVGMMPSPVSVDWDKDGDEDLICGNSAGFIEIVKNLSKEEERPLTDPSWDKPVRMTLPDGEVYRIMAGMTGSIQGPMERTLGYTELSVADWDGDGVLDVMSNNVLGAYYWFRGIEGEFYTLDYPRPVEVEWENGPKIPEWYNYDWRKDVDKELISQWRTTPFMIDLPVDKDGDGIAKGDGLMDLVTVDHEGYLTFFERYLASDGTLKLKEGKRIFKNSDGGQLRLNKEINGASGRQMFTVTDYNKDGKLDLIVDDLTNVGYFENVSMKNGEYVFADAETLHSRRIAYHDTCPTTCDWDDDGYVDLIIGAEDGKFYYLKNTKKPVSSGSEGEGGTGDAGEENNLDKHLVAHWDFEGTGDAVYQDKSVGGTVSDTLSATDNTMVSIADGVATLTNKGALKALDSVDLDLPGTMTLFARMKVTGSGTNSEFNIFSKAKGMYDNATFDLLAFNASDTTYKFNVHAQDVNKQESIWATNNEATKSVWREVALVIDKNENDVLTYKVIISNDELTTSGSDYTITKQGTTKTNATIALTNDEPLYIGYAGYRESNCDMVRMFDDVRIYNKALTPDEIATLMPGPSIDDHLVAHWDFEGDAETALTDKAPVGTANNLTSAGTVSVQNGVATIQPGGYLITPNQADLNQGQEMTIFMRINPEYGNIHFMDKASGAHYAFRLCTWQGKLDFCVSDGPNGVSPVSEANKLKSSAWCEVAVVVSKNEAGYLTYEIFMSKDSSTGTGGDFESVAKQTATYTKEQLNSQPLIIGNDFNKTFSQATCQYDDVRIYNTALTTDELATLIPDYKNMPGLMAHWDFGGDAETALLDKAVNSAEADNLEIGGTNGNVVIKDGIATISGDGYMQAANSSDLSLSGEMTLFVRAKVSRQSLQKPEASFIDKRSDSLYAYALNMWAYDSDIYYLNYQMGIDSKVTLEKRDFLGEDEWREIAVVVAKNERGKLTYELLMSKNEVTNDEDDFVSLYKVTTPYDSHGVNSAPVIIGNTFKLLNSSLVRTIDDIRIYNGAMTAKEIAGFITTAEGDDTSYYLKSLENDAYISFDANKFAYKTETTKETFTMTPVTDDAVALKVNGSPVTSGESKTYDLEVGSNLFTITVGDDGTTNYKTYTVNVTRNEVPTLSVDELLAQIDSAKGIAQGEYTDSSFAELQTVIASAQAVADDSEATDAERIEAAESLQRAIAGLTSEMRYADLKELVTVAGNLQNTGYQKWADYKKWSEKAQAIVSTKAPYLGEVAEVYAGLKNAYDKLMSEESLPAVSLEGFRNVTTWNYAKGRSQMPDSGEYTQYTLYDLTDVEGNPINSLDKVLLSMKVKFAAAGGSSQLCFGYAGSEFRLYPIHDGYLNFKISSYGIDEGLWAEYTSVPHMVNQEFNLQISYEYLDTDGDKTDDALRIGFYLNGKLYEDRHFVVENCDVNNISSVLGAVYSDNAVTISSLVVAEEDHWNLDNGDYQLGDGAVWVDNQTPSGTSLNTVGDYQVAKIAQNNVVNYAILYKTGDANADNTNDVKDLVASLKASAGEKADKRAAVLGADVNEDETMNEKDTALIREILIK